MGASISIHWPGITDEDLAFDFGFQNDDHAWANWIVEVESNRSLKSLMDQLDIRPLATHTTDGMNDRDVRWVSPQQLTDAAWTLIHLIENDDPRIAPLLKAYQKGANNIDPIPEELGRDLADLILRSKHALEGNIPRMTLYIGW